MFSLRWKEFFRLKKIQEEKKRSLSPRSQATSFFDDEVDQWKKTEDATGLNTRLGPKNKNPQPPKGTNELECFIKDIQRELIGKILPHNDTQKQKTKAIEPISASIQDVMKNLKDTNQVIIPTDKTNSFELLDIKTLYIFIQKHINKKAKQIDKERLSTTVDEAIKLIEEWKNKGTLNEKEAKYALESIQSRAVPVPKLLIRLTSFQTTLLSKS